MMTGNQIPVFEDDDDRNYRDWVRAGLDTAVEQAGPVKIRTVTVPPGRWVPVLTAGHPGTLREPDTRQVVEVFQDNGHDVDFDIWDDRSVSFAGSGHPIHGTVDTRASDYPADGWRVRWVPYDDSTLRRMDVEGQPAAPMPHVELPPPGEPGPDRIAVVDAVEAAQRATRDLVNAGYAKVVRLTDGTERYRLTEAGCRHAERLLGLPHGSVPE